jgi:thymidylate synthase (FAD)
MQIEFLRQNILGIQEFSQNEILTKIERIGRSCYQSTNKITDNSKYDFFNMLLRNKHYSVLEHINFTIKFITNRAIANALIRHRHISVSQESTHFINYAQKNKLSFIIPANLSDDQIKCYKTYYYNLFYCYDEAINVYKLKSEIARDILPLGLKTELYITTNLTQWRYMINLRTRKNCHPQMKNLMLQVFNWFNSNYPWFVSDIVIEGND